MLTTLHLSKLNFMNDNTKTKKLSSCGYIIIGLGLFTVISIFAYQLFHWYKNGEWLSLPLHKALEYFGISFIGILDLDSQSLQKFIFWILEQSLAGVIGVTTLVIGWLMTLKD